MYHCFMCFNPHQARLWHISKLMPPVLAVHMEAHATLPVLYASSWLMTCFASDFPIPFASRVMDTVLCETYVEPMMKVRRHSGTSLITALTGGADGAEVQRARPPGHDWYEARA